MRAGRETIGPRRPPPPLVKVARSRRQTSNETSDGREPGAKEALELRPLGALVFLTLRSWPSLTTGAGAVCGERESAARRRRGNRRWAARRDATAVGGGGSKVDAPAGAFHELNSREKKKLLSVWLRAPNSPVPRLLQREPKHKKKKPAALPV